MTGCALVLLKVRDGLTTSFGRPSKFFRSADPRIVRKRGGDSNGVDYGLVERRGVQSLDIQRFARVGAAEALQITNLRRHECEQYGAAITNRSAARHRHHLDLVAGLKQMATMTIADIKRSALANGNVKLVPQLPSGPSQYERLGTIHDIDPLENIERELREIDETIAGLKEEAEQPGEARKYAQTMLRQLTITRADLIAIKEKWLQPA